MAERQRITEALRQQVRERAQGRCEYCLLHDEDTLLLHEADHVIAQKHRGTTTADNLAWACAACNRYKGTDIGSIDEHTGKLAPLFNPRTQHWQRHFRLNGARIEPLTASGRATEQLLRLNEEARLIERVILRSIGHYPRR